MDLGLGLARSLPSNVKVTNLSSFSVISHPRSHAMKQTSSAEFSGNLFSEINHSV